MGRLACICVYVCSLACASMDVCVCVCKRPRECVSARVPVCKGYGGADRRNSWGRKCRLRVLQGLRSHSGGALKGGVDRTSVPFQRPNAAGGNIPREVRSHRPGGTSSCIPALASLAPVVGPDSEGLNL